MTKWKYRIVILSGYAYERLRQLNGYGQEGWELVSKTGNECTFKRPIATDSD